MPFLSTSLAVLTSGPNIPPSILIFGYVVAPIVLPTFIGVLRGRSLPRLSTLEATLVGMAAAAGLYLFSAIWWGFTLHNGLLLWLLFAIPVWLVAGCVIPWLVCSQINRSRAGHSPAGYERENNFRRDAAIAVVYCAVFVGYAYWVLDSEYLVARPVGLF